MLRQMQREGCHLLVATPGRLNDLLEDPYSKVSAPNLSTLVLDEADRLLDGGFSADIEHIIEQFPRRDEVDRQTLLFSATVPREVMSLVRNTLKPDFRFVQTVKAGEAATHEKIPQKMVTIAGFENSMPTVLELCQREIEKANQSKSTSGETKPFKAIVYFSSTVNVQLAAGIFNELRSEKGGVFGSHPLHPAQVLEMHGQLTQRSRENTSMRFRKAESAILFSTDVTARGMDFPGVTHVIQVGLPPNRDQYIHRLGRTGRGAAGGEGWIILHGVETGAARQKLRGMPLVPDKTLGAATVDMTQDAQLPAPLASVLSQVANATKMVDRDTKAKAYMGALGEKIASVRDKEAFIAALNQWSKFGWGWESPPSISSALAQRIGVAGTRGLNIGSRGPNSDSGDRGSSGFSRGGSSSYGGDRGGRGGGRSSYGGDRDGGRPSYGGGRDGDRDGGRPSYGGNRDGGRDGGRPSYSGGRGGGRSSFGGDRGDRGGNRGDRGGDRSIFSERS